MSKLGKKPIIIPKDTKVKLESGNTDLFFIQLDLADLLSIHKFVENFKKKFNKLDILVNNAGIMMCPKLKTKDGFEMQFGTNHLGHFLLTELLLDLLIKTEDSRVINVSSLIANFAFVKTPWRKVS